jgi:AraC-like DNA-binding protein
MLLFYSGSDLALTPSFMAGQMSDAYGTFFRFGDYDYSAFLSSFVTAGSRSMFFPGMDYVWESIPLRGILYRMRLGLSGDASLFFLLPEQQILETFSSVFADNGALFLYDSEANLLFSHGGGFPPTQTGIDLPGDNGLLPTGYLGPGLIGAYSRSAYGLFYISALDSDTAMNHVRNLRNLTLILNIAAVALSLGYALFLAARNSRRVAEAFRLLDENPNLPSYEGGNIFSYLNLAVNRLVSANALLRQDADSWRETLRDAFLDRLLSGGWESPEEAAAAAEQADIALTNRRFCVALIFLSLNKPSEQSIHDAKENCLAVLGESLKDIRDKTLDVLVYRRNPSRLGVFFSFDKERRTDFRKDLEDFFHKLMEETMFRVAASGLQDDIFCLHEEYKHCREYALICDNWENPSIHWIDKLPPPQRSIFVFPPEAEQKIINQLHNADIEAASASIHGIFAANLQESLLTESMLLIFYTSLQACFLRALEDSLAEQYRDAIQNLDFRRPPKDLEKDFIDLAKNICASFAAEYSKKNAIIKKEELTAYVEAHFSEDKLSLSLAAQHFGFSETYFSQMFKDITGENFSTFTEITRLNKAQVLLKEYLKIEEIAYRCGYKSPASFRRAYKRYFGVNPAGNR